MIARVPLMLEPRPEGKYTVTSPLLPELITEGNTIAEALRSAQDAFDAVVEMYEDFDRVLPSELFVKNPNGILRVEILSPSPIASVPPIPESVNKNAAKGSPVIASIPLTLYPQPEGGYTVESPALREFLTDADTVEEALRAGCIRDSGGDVRAFQRHAAGECIFLKNTDEAFSTEILAQVTVTAPIPIPAR